MNANEGIVNRQINHLGLFRDQIGPESFATTYHEYHAAYARTTPL